MLPSPTKHGLRRGLSAFCQAMAAQSLPPYVRRVRSSSASSRGARYTGSRGTNGVQMDATARRRVGWCSAKRHTSAPPLCRGAECRSATHALRVAVPSTGLPSGVAPVVANEDGERLLKVVDDSDEVGAALLQRVVVRLRRVVAVPKPAQIRRDDVEAGLRQRRHHTPPRVPDLAQRADGTQRRNGSAFVQLRAAGLFRSYLGPAMAEDHERPVADPAKHCRGVAPQPLPTLPGSAATHHELFEQPRSHVPIRRPSGLHTCPTLNGPSVAGSGARSRPPSGSAILAVRPAVDPDQPLCSPVDLVPRQPDRLG